MIEHGRKNVFFRAITLALALIMALGMLSLSQPLALTANNGIPGLNKAPGSIVTIDGIEWVIVKSQYMTASQKTAYMLILNDVIYPNTNGVVYATSFTEYNNGNYFNNRVQQQIDGWYASLYSPTLKQWAIKPNYYGTWIDNTNTLSMAGSQTSRVAMLPLKADVFPSLSVGLLSLLTPQNPVSNMRQWWTDTTATDSSGAIGYKEVLLSSGMWGIKAYNTSGVFARPIIWVLGETITPAKEIQEDSTGLMLLGRKPGDIVSIDGIEWVLVKSQYMTASMRTVYLLILNDVVYPNTSGVVYATSITEFNKGNFFNNRVQQQIDGWYAALSSPSLKRWAIKPNYYGTWLNNTNTLELAKSQTSRVAMLPLKDDVFPALSTGQLSLLTPKNPASNMKQWWTDTTATDSSGAIGYKTVLLSSGIWGLKGYNSKDVFARPEIWVLGSNNTTPATYNVTYYANNDSGQSQTITAPSNTNFTINGPAYTWGTRKFAGWNTKADGTGETFWNGDVIYLSGKTDLYAKWGKEAIRVTGYVWPMATVERVPGFLAMHDVVVELRSTFNTPASGNLSTRAVLVSAASKTGQFTFDDVPVGTYVLYIYRPGYLIRTMMVTITENSGPTVFLMPPGTADRGIFNLWWGDCSGDHRVENDDINMILELLVINVSALDPEYNPACDMNADGRCDSDDIQLVLEMWDKTSMDYPGTEGVDPYK